ncbi:MAG TPA: hypothetical protein VEC17_02625 [Candidatus Binatia bacterium]|nr:hypothetical protein [Candidatus Binatia bacterium]
MTEQIIQLLREKGPMKASEIINELLNRKAGDEYDIREGIWSLWRSDRVVVSPDRYLNLAN